MNTTYRAICLSTCSFWLLIASSLASQHRFKRENDNRHSCTLPFPPQNGNYSVRSCKAGDQNPICLKIPGTLVPDGEILSFTCDEGYIIQDKIKYNFCLNGTWEPETPKCLKMCDSLPAECKDVKCTYRGNSIDCNKKHLPGTKFRSGFNQDKKLEEGECLLNGTWSAKPTCNATVEKVIAESKECGTINNMNFINETLGVTHPWQATVYLREDERKGYTYTCGGTIISEHLILTAAHCIYMEREKRNIDAKDVRVSVGKDFYDNTLGESFEESFPVKEVVRHTFYLGKLNVFDHDIALLLLQFKLKISNTVMPICIDWAKNHFQEGDLATVNALQYIQYEKEGDKGEGYMVELLKLKYVDNYSCYKMGPPTFLKYITPDSFCTINHNALEKDIVSRKSSKRFLMGNGGAGLTFERNGRYYIYGIISRQPKKGNFTVSTNVSHYTTWLRKEMISLKPTEQRNQTKFPIPF